MAQVEPLWDPTTGKGTFTNGTLSVFVAAPGAGKALVLKGAFGSCPGLDFEWRLDNNGTTVQQGRGLSNADAGFTIDGPILMAVNGSVGLKIIPAAGTSTCMANLVTRVLPGLR